MLLENCSKESAMSIHEIATLTSKGQLTLPKPIRQALEVDIGGKVAFDLRGDEIVVTRADEIQHKDPAIGAFLSVLEQGIQTGQHLVSLSEDLAQAMLANLDRNIDLDADIRGDVAL